MSTLKTTNLQHPSAASPAIVLDAAGDATYAGVHDFSAATVTGAPQGLTHINTTTFSGVTSVSLDNVFTSDYDYYQILTDLQGTANAGLNLRMRVGGVDATTLNYTYQYIEGSGTGVFAGRTNTYQALIGGVQSDSPSAYVTTMYNPNKTVKTYMQTLGDKGLIGSQLFIVSNVHTLANAYDGFTMYPVSGTIAGKVRVYGYKNGA